MKVLLFLVGVFSLDISSSFPKPTPRLELLDSAPWDSAFTYSLNDKELQEIDSICGWLSRNMKDRLEFVSSPNGRHKVKIRFFRLYEGSAYEDNSWVEAAYFNEKDMQVWFDTLEDIRPDLRPSTLTNDGKNLITYDSYGCAGLVFYEVSPLPKYLGTAGCFDYGWELLEQENLVFGLSLDLMGLYQTDGTPIWEKDSLSSLKSLRLSMFCVSKDEEAILTGHYDEINKEVSLSLWNINGKRENEIVFSSPKSYLRSIYVSSSKPRLAIAVFDGALVCFDMDSKKKLWDYKYPDPNFWSGSVGFFPDGKTIAAVISHWNPKEEKPHIQLFDTKTGILQGNYVNLDDGMKLWRETSKIDFTENGKYLIAVMPKREYLFRVNYED